MNPHPEIFPKLIELLNKKEALFYDYLSKFGIVDNDAEEIRLIVEKWAFDNDIYLNEN